MSTLVNESLEIETTGMDLVDETVSETDLEKNVEDAALENSGLENTDVQNATEASLDASTEDNVATSSSTPEVDLSKTEERIDTRSQPIEVEGVTVESAEETLESEDITDVTDIMELQPTDLSNAEDLPATESNVANQSEEVIATKVEQTNADLDAVHDAETETVSEMNLSEEDSEANTQVSTKASTEEHVDSEEPDQTTATETLEAETEISQNETSEATEGEEEKPSRSRALLLTSLLSTTKPISLKELKKVLKLPEKAILAAIADLKTTLYEQDLGLMMEEVAGGYRVIIQPALYADLAELISPPPLPQLSSAALETLAIISYKQPITRGELEAARGTGCSSTLDTLQERDLIKIVGQKDVVGKPLLYGTTERFLLEFGLKSLEDLPPLDEKPTEFLRS